MSCLQIIQLTVVVEIVVVEEIVEQHPVDDGVLQILYILDGDLFLLLVAAGGSVLHKLESRNIMEVLLHLLAGFVPSLVGRHDHRVVAVLTLDEGCEAGKEIVVLVEDRVKVGDLSVKHRSLYALLLVEFLHVVAMEKLGDRVQRILVVVERLIDVSPEGDLPVEHVQGAVTTGDVGLGKADALNGIGHRAIEEHQLLVEGVDTLIDGARGGIVVTGDMVHDELALHACIAHR